MSWLRRILITLVVLAGLCIIGVTALFGFLAFLGGTHYRHEGPDDGSTKEIVFVTQSIPKTDGGPKSPRAWVLRVPKSYLVRESGANWVGSYSVALRMSHDTQTFELKPNPRSFTSENGWSEYFLDIRNKPFSHIRKTDICIDEQDRREHYRGEIPKASRFEPIRDCTSANCRYQMAYHGWDVEIVVDRRLYMNKIQYCEFTRDLLRKWTVKIENIHD